MITPPLAWPLCSLIYHFSSTLSPKAGEEAGSDDSWRGLCNELFGWLSPAQVLCPKVVRMFYGTQKNHHCDFHFLLPTCSLLTVVVTVLC